MKWLLDDKYNDMLNLSKSWDILHLYPDVSWAVLLTNPDVEDGVLRYNSID